MVEGISSSGSNYSPADIKGNTQQPAEEFRLNVNDRISTDSRSMGQVPRATVQYCNMSAQEALDFINDPS